MKNVKMDIDLPPLVAKTIMQQTKDFFTQTFISWFVRLFLIITAVITFFTWKSETKLREQLQKELHSQVQYHGR